MRVLLPLVALLAGCAVINLPYPPEGVSVLGPPSVSDRQLVGWYVEHAPPGYRATVSLPELAATFIQEGVKEGVRGDVAFMQAILETGWFRWPGGSVTPDDNNFAGLGATDTNPNANRFATARDGVRAQLQHLRRYANPQATVCSTDPCLDVRFNLVRPPGKAPYWEQFGNGIWASSTNNYGGRILLLFAGAIQYRDAHV